MKILKIENIGYFFVLFLLISFLSYLIKDCSEPKGYERSKIICDSIYKMEIKGIITKIYHDRTDHNALKYVVSNQLQKMIVYNNSTYKIDNLETVFSAGDSIYKPANSFKNYLYKGGDKNKLLVIQAYSCCCGDSIPANCDSIIEVWKKQF